MATALYQKYRPKNITEIVGQEHVVKTIINSSKNNNISHAYLITGTRGTGKTTLARILARIVNCDTAPNAFYSDEDENVKAIDQGRFPDIQELDAASNSSIDNIREIINHSYDTPIMGSKRVFIIDEVHCLKAPAVSALLKILEEPPKHAMFILCTTDPQKVLSTIHSRCQRLQLRNIPLSKISDRIKFICDAEGIEGVTNDIINLIAKSGRGSLRDAISNLDSIVGRCGKTFSLEEVSGVLGQPNISYLFLLIAFINNCNYEKSIKTVKTLIGNGTNPEDIFNGILDISHDLMICKCIGSSEHILIPEEIKDKWNSAVEKIEEKSLVLIIKKVGSYIERLSFMPRSDIMLNACIVDIIQCIKDKKETKF